MVAEVDVHPLTSRTASLRHRNGHQLGSDTLVSRSCGDHSVLDSGVDETIPGHVDEPDKRVAGGRDGLDQVLAENPL